MVTNPFEKSLSRKPSRDSSKETGENESPPRSPRLHSTLIRDISPKHNNPCDTITGTEGARRISQEVLGGLGDNHRDNRNQDLERQKQLIQEKIRELELREQKVKLREQKVKLSEGMSESDKQLRDAHDASKDAEISLLKAEKSLHNAQDLKVRREKHIDDAKDRRQAAINIKAKKSMTKRRWKRQGNTQTKR